MGTPPKPRKFFYWEWTAFHVLVFFLRMLLCALPAGIVLIVLLALVMPGPPADGSWLWWGFGALVLALSALLTNAIFYICRGITIRGQMEYGPRLMAVASGILFVLVMTGRLEGKGNISTASALLAGLALLALNFVAWLLRLVFHREMIFHENPEDAPRQKPRARKKK